MSYKNKIEEINLKDLSLSDYLEESLKSDNKNLCKGWDYLKNNLTTKLKNILLDEEYNKITYNSDNVKFILKEIEGNLNEDLKKQLGSFVYVWKDIKRDCEKQESEEKLNKDLTDRDFIFNDNLNIESLKILDGLKVVCVLDISINGLMGNFNRIEEKEGKFIYSESYKGLMLIPKRSRTRGFLIKKRFYYKELLK